MVLETQDMSKRNYENELKWQATPEQRKRRAKRNAARRRLMREGKVKRGDNLDVDHKDGNPNNNSRGNLRVLPRSVNRSKK